VIEETIGQWMAAVKCVAIRITFFTLYRLLARRTAIATGWNNGCQHS
jgi:hypothetical protein